MLINEFSILVVDWFCLVQTGIKLLSLLRYSCYIWLWDSYFQMKTIFPIMLDGPVCMQQLFFQLCLKVWIQQPFFHLPRSYQNATAASSLCSSRHVSSAKLFSMFFLVQPQSWIPQVNIDSSMVLNISNLLYADKW